MLNSGQGSVTLLPGLYYLKGGGLAVTGQGGFSGDGVVIYNDGGSGISFSGGGDVRLTPPTAGTYQDITLFQDRSSATAISLSGNGGLNITGTVYAAHAKLSVTGKTPKKQRKTPIRNRPSEKGRNLVT